MKARTPAQVHDHFSTAFNAGDMESLVSLYERDAILVLAPTQIWPRRNAKIAKRSESISDRSLCALCAPLVADKIFSTWLVVIDNPYGTAL